MNKIKTVIDAMARLTNTSRFSQFQLCVPENVMEHSASVTMLCFFMADSIEKELKKDLFDYKELFTKALFHDFDEFATGDISRPMKYASKEIRDEIYKVEKNTVQNFAKQINCFEVFNSWISAKDDSLEGGLVALADKFVIVTKVYDEAVRRGNMTISECIPDKIIEDICNIVYEFYNRLDVNKLDFLDEIAGFSQNASNQIKVNRQTNGN